jgi:DNA modification methylase
MTDETGAKPPSVTIGRRSRSLRQPRGLSERVVWRPIGELKSFPGNPRRHPEAQIARLVRSIERVWTNPLLIDEAGTILAGHARLEAAKRLGRTQVPTVTLAGLSESEKSAVVIADNSLPEQAVWDFDLLRKHFENLIVLDFEVELTGFSTGEIDLVMDSKPAAGAIDPADDQTAFALEGPAVSQFGDVWQLGRHRLICADVVSGDCYGQLLQGDLAQMVITDPPYNVLIDGHATGRGKVRHRERRMAPGEISEPTLTKSLERSIRWVITFSQSGSIHYIFVDWRHLPDLLNVARPLYAEWKDLLVWNKSNAVRGSLYGSKHELIAVFKNGAGPHIQNFGRGNGRHRANVLDYAGANSLNAGGQAELDVHRTEKPVDLIADLIRDCSRRNGIILDPFGGSGTTIVAAEQAGRVARVIELDPLNVDAAIRRWEGTTGIPVQHAEINLSFAALGAQREVGSGHVKPVAPAARRGGRSKASRS